ncbi:MAG TPA: hypothetical protein VMY18_05875 [Acidobacteriota bacterium]|nr:hypothetical protein [Acidobacteriota bacterium]
MKVQDLANWRGRITNYVLIVVELSSQRICPAGDGQLTRSAEWVKGIVGNALYTLEGWEI